MLHSPSSSAGQLAARFAGLFLPLQVLRSGAGYYIGTQNEDGPVSRESVEYFSTHSQGSSPSRWCKFRSSLPVR